MKSPCIILWSLSLLFNLAHIYILSHHLALCKFFQSTGYVPFKVPSTVPITMLFWYLLADLYLRISHLAPKQPVASPSWGLHCHQLNRQSLWRADSAGAWLTVWVHSHWLINICICRTTHSALGFLLWKVTQESREWNRNPLQPSLVVFTASQWTYSMFSIAGSWATYQPFWRRWWWFWN